MANATTSKTSSDKSVKDFLANKKLVILAALLILIVAVAGYVIANHSNSSKKPANTITASYRETKNYSLAGSGSGNGAAYNLPSPLTQATKSSHDTHPSDHNSYKELVNKAPKSFAFISSTVYTQPPPAKNTAGVITMLNARFPTSNISVQPLETFKNASIQSNAWVTDFTASPQGKTGSQVFGKVVYAIGNKAYYYFMVAAVAPTWQDNTGAWEPALNSLKINQ